MGQRKTVKEFIKATKRIHGNKYDYSKVDYVNTKQKVEIICPIHGPFLQIPDSHLRGRGCPKCALSGKQSKVTTKDFIFKAQKIHGDKYNYSKVNYINTHIKVCIICVTCGNEFWQEPRAHLSGQGCPRCANSKKGISQKSNTFTFINKAKQVHGDKYDYSQVKYINNHTKVEIICPIHGSFWQLPHNHLDGKGCAKCGYKKVSLRKLRVVNDFIKQAKEVHGSKYDYSKVDYKGNEVPVCIICPIHGQFMQTPGNHLSGKGCSKCGRDKLAKLFSKDVSQFIKDANRIHENKYDYSEVEYVDSKTNIKVMCPEHGAFWQRPDHHLNGHGCPKCSHVESSYEEYLYECLLNYFGKNDVEREYDDDERYPFHCDFYVKSKDLFIEINGFWTHNNHWFDETNEDDIKQLEDWKAKDGVFYSDAVQIWADSDIRKRECARRNNLNYVVLWTAEDIDEWIADGYPIRKDWK